MTRIAFRYDPQMEVENFRATFASRNHREASPRQLLFRKRYRTLTRSTAAQFSREYLAELGVRPSAYLADVRERWARVERRFFARANRIWGKQLPQRRITAYLTAMDRCGYSFRRGHFFIATGPRGAIRTAMHELWHFYFYFTVGRAIHERYGAGRFNDIKEALTVLLNVECADLMPGLTDRGYPQHRKLRSFIRRSYAQTRDIFRTIDRALRV